MGVRHKRWPHEQCADRDLLVVEALTGELQHTALVAVVEAHRSTDLGDVVVQRKVGAASTSRVFDNERVAHASVRDRRPMRAKHWYDELADVTSEVREKDGTDGRERHFPPRNRIVGVAPPGTGGLGGRDHRLAHLWGPERGR